MDTYDNSEIERLVNMHGIPAVLQHLAEVAENLSGEEAAWLHNGLYGLLDRYYEYFDVQEEAEPEQLALHFYPTGPVLV